MPLALSASGRATGASNMNGLEPLEWFGATGVSMLTNPKSAELKDVADIGEKGGPALDILSSCRRGGTDGLVGNDVAGDCETDVGKLVGIGNGGFGRVNADMEARASQH